MTEQLHTLLRYPTTDSNHLFKQRWTPELDKKYYTERGDYPIHDAVVNGNSEIVQFLLEKGINPNIRITRGFTPLMSGWYSHPAHRIECYLLVLRYGGNPYLKDIFGEDAFVRARRWIWCKQYLESYLLVELVCGEADSLVLDIWRVVKPFIYKL